MGHEAQAQNSNQRALGGRKGLNIDGSKQEEGVNYWETFSPVAPWAAIRMVLITTLVRAWYTKQIDNVLAYTQADVECELYMVIPKGFEPDDDVQDYVLKLKKNLFGQEQAGRVWNQHLVNRLKEGSFISSEIDECIFYKGKSAFVLYTDDSILAGPDPQELDDIHLRAPICRIKIYPKSLLSERGLFFYVYI